MPEDQDVTIEVEGLDVIVAHGLISMDPQQEPIIGSLLKICHLGCLGKISKISCVGPGRSPMLMLIMIGETKELWSLVAVVTWIVL